MREVKALGINPKHNASHFLHRFFIAALECLTQNHETFPPRFRLQNLLWERLLIRWIPWPDYTKPLNEPGWGDLDGEEDSDVDMDADSLLDCVDEPDDYEDKDIERGWIGWANQSWEEGKPGLKLWCCLFYAWLFLASFPIFCWFKRQPIVLLRRFALLHSNLIFFSLMSCGSVALGV